MARYAPKEIPLGDAASSRLQGASALATIKVVQRQAQIVTQAGSMLPEFPAPLLPDKKSIDFFPVAST